MTGEQLYHQFTRAIAQRGYPIGVTKSRLRGICEQIASGSKQPSQFPADLNADHQAVLTELMNPTAPPEPTEAELALRELQASDRDTIRVVEDLWALLKSNLGLTDDDLPAEAAAKLARRKELRQQLGGGE